jgi:hypothetical protein
MRGRSGCRRPVTANASVVPEYSVTVRSNEAPGAVETELDRGGTLR